jgi:ferredoxin-nitrate reductase
LLVRETHIGFPLIDADGGKFVHAALTNGGVKVVYEDEVERYEGSKKVETVVTKKGERFEVDLVIECIGVAPELGFLGELDIVERGRVRVDESMRTTTTGIFAAGDVAIAKTAEGNDVTCHNWNVAISQARVASEVMTGGEAKWSEGVAYNADSFYDQEFAIVGPWERRHEAGRKIRTQITDEAYRAVVSVDGVIESAIVIGDKTGDKLLRKLIASKANIKGKFDKLFDADAKPGDFV